MSFDKQELLKLADLLDAKAATAEAAAIEFTKHCEIKNATQETKRAENARHFATVCRDAHSALGKVRKCRTPTKTRGGEDSEAFSAFWQAYPNKAGKGDARRAWITMRCEEIAPKVMQGLESSKKSAPWVRDAGAFIPFPATWLRREGWDDVHTPSARIAGVPMQADPSGWVSFCNDKGYSYQEHRFAPDWMKSEFRKTQKK